MTPGTVCLWLKRSLCTIVESPSSRIDLMRLPRQLFVAVTIFVATSCSDVTSPKRLSQSYTLTSIDGRSLPVVDEVITGTLIVTTVWGTLTLNEGGTATTVTHTRRVDVGLDSLEYSDSTSFGYRISGDSIEIAPTGTCHELCLRNREGKLTESSITLTDKLNPHSAPIYLYTVI